MKSLLKTAVNALALILVLPCLLVFWAGSLAIGRQRAFAGWSQAFSLIPGLCGVYLRRAFYRCVFPRCAADVCLSFGTVFSHPTAEVGKSVYVGLYCVLGDVILEDDVLIGSHVSVMDGGAQLGI
jgi:virginiamycin A acetyltransferase